MPSPSTRDQILAAARMAFIDEGYGISMEAIARHAGVAKQTLYNHFASKSELFVEVVRVVADDIMLALNHAPGGLREQLLSFARVARRQLFSSENMALIRLMHTEAKRFPDEMRQVFEIGGGRAHHDLVETLSKASANGILAFPSAEFAADMFLSMLKGFEYERLMLNAGRPGDGAEARAEEIVSTFMKAFARSPDTPTPR